jgi:hypothetical protein
VRRVHDSGNPRAFRGQQAAIFARDRPDKLAREAVAGPVGLDADRMLTSTGAGAGAEASAAGGGGACGTAETTGPDALGLGCPEGGGVVVVTRVGSFWPCAGGCTTVVTVLPSLSTLATCCGWPVAAACFFASSSAFSCFEEQPSIPAAMTKANAGTVVHRQIKLALLMIEPRLLLV